MVKFEMRRVSEVMNGESGRMYPRIIKAGVIGTDELAKQIMTATSLTEADVYSALIALSEAMTDWMALGFSVRLDGIGTFRPRIALKEEAEPETEDGKTKRNARSVEVDNVIFRADKKLTRQTDRKASFERVGSRSKPVTEVSPYTLPERIERASAYIRTHGVMTTGEYAALNRLSVSSAGRELRTLRNAEGAPFRTKGRGSHIFYTLREDSAKAKP